jgi:hypothetical protein
MKKGDEGLFGHDKHNRSKAAPDVALNHRAAGKYLRGDEAHNFRADLTAEAQGNNKEPKKLGPAPAPLPEHMSHGWGDRHQRDGHLRTTNKGHHIGKR